MQISSGAERLKTASEPPTDGTRRRHRHRWIFSGIMSDASHDDLKQQPHAGKPRGAGERWRKSFNGYPLTTGAETASCTSKHPTVVGGSRASSLSLADALCRRPRRRLGDCIAILRFANLHPTSPGGREVFDRLGAYCSEVTSSSSRRPCASQAPSSSWRSSPLLPSSPYCPPGQSLVAVSRQHLRESQALHLDYYKRKEKKIFDIKETCRGHPRGRRRGGGVPRAPT